MTTQILQVPGARLHYDVTGDGPVLLLIPGGPAGAGVFAAVVAPLAERYTVVTYDPRGISRSALDGPPGGNGIEEHSDDVHRLLAELGTEPARVFGSSGGAVTALDLISRHPDQVGTLIAHEPPIIRLLGDTAGGGPDAKDLHETYLAEGVVAGMRKFLVGAGFGDAAAAMTGSLPPEVAADFSYFLGHLIVAVDDYVPDPVAIGAASTRLVIGVGEGSAGQPANEAGRALAADLGVEPVVFPGGHGGFHEHPAEFAAAVLKVLAD